MANVEFSGRIAWIYKQNALLLVVERKIFTYENTSFIRHAWSAQSASRITVADVIIHSGDFCFGGPKREIIDFLNWFCYPPYKYKILIAGNHDDFLWDSEIEFLHENCYGLSYSCVTIEGVKFHGIPMFVQDCVSGLINTGIEKIRPDTDVLITHCPPFEILDFDNNIHYGSKELLTAVEKIKPRYHLFGHIHANNGIEVHGSTTFINSAIVNEIYGDIQPWHLIEI